MLVRAGAEVIVREDRADRAVPASAIEQRIRPPALDRRLRAAPEVLVAAARISAEAARIARHRPAVLEQWIGLQRQRRRRPGLREGRDALAHFIGGERAILVVPPVARAVRRGHVELHEMDVLPERVGGRIDLEVVEIQGARHEVGGVELDAVTRVGAEEERFGRAAAGQRRRDVALEHGDARLRIVPPPFVHRQVELDVGRAVVAQEDRIVRPDAEGVGTGIGVRCARLLQPAVHREARIRRRRSSARQCRPCGEVLAWLPRVVVDVGGHGS
jgi:hypothetical protein